MIVSQQLNFIYIVVHCWEVDPFVHIQLINSTCVRIIHNWEARYYLTKKDIVWPGLVSADDFGKIQLILQKKKEKMWKKFDCITTYYQGLKPLAIPDYYPMKVVQKIKLNNNLYLIRLVNKMNVWSPVGIGKHVFIKKTLDGKERIRPYNHVPLFPIMNLSYPNPMPGELLRSDDPINLIVKSYSEGIVSKWLTEREIGDEVLVSNQQGTFTKKNLEGVRLLYLISAGTGITPMLSILVWVLQRSRADIRLISFNELEEDLTWYKEIKNIHNFDKRFKVQFIVSNATYGWQGRVGRATPKFLEAIIPIEKNATKSYFCICGPPSFMDRVVGHITSFLQIPREEIFLFEGQEHDKYARNIKIK